MDKLVRDEGKKVFGKVRHEWAMVPATDEQVKMTMNM